MKISVFKVDMLIKINYKDVFSVRVLFNTFYGVIVIIACNAYSILIYYL